MKKFLHLFSVLTILLLCAILPTKANAAIIDSGTCGSDLTWVLDDSGVLTISGAGRMDNYFDNSPWEDFHESIVKVVIEEGVTSIGACAFMNCENITTVSIADTVTSIGNLAFLHGDNLTSVNIPSSITEIGGCAFSELGKSRNVYITDLSAWMRISFKDGGSSPLHTDGSNLYLNGTLVTEVTIPKGITVLNPAVLACDALVNVVIPEGVTHIKEDAFYGCKNLKSISLPSSVTHIGKSAFSRSALEKITLPDGITTIPHFAFLNCANLTEITIPGSVTNISTTAFLGCRELKDVYFAGTQAQWDVAVEAFDKPYDLLEANIHIQGGAVKPTTTPTASPTTPTVKPTAAPTTIPETAPASASTTKPTVAPTIKTSASTTEATIIPATAPTSVPTTAPTTVPTTAPTTAPTTTPTTAPTVAGELVVYSDGTDLSIEIGDKLTLSVAVVSDTGKTLDPSGITFQLGDNYLTPLDTGVYKEANRFYVQLQGAISGTTYITFSDSTTGKTATIPITVVATNYETYTIHTIPVGTVYNGVRNEGPVNFYNVNGMYVDGFSRYVNEDGSATVNFNVYNSNYTYGIVEVYDQDGELYNVVLLDKMSGLNGSIKEVLWDGTGAFLRDTLIRRTGLSYKQETNFTKSTVVKVDIPKDGYIKITADALESDILAVVNSADLLMTALSVSGKLRGYDDSYEISERLTLDIFTDAAYAQIMKDGKGFFKDILKDCAKETVISSKTAGNLMETIYKNFTELKLTDIIIKNIQKSGISITESVFKELMGVFGEALDAVFMMGKIEDMSRQYISYADTVNGGAITIANQGGGIRHADRVVLKSAIDFDPEVALQVYTVVLEESQLEKIKNADAQVYEQLTKSLIRTYNISLMKNGKVAQHNGDVSVYIPIPTDLNLGLSGNIKVYRIEDDGTLTNMDAIVENDCIMFTTDHFSLYALVGDESSQNPTDSTTAPTTEASIPTESTKSTEFTEPTESIEPTDAKKGSNIGTIISIVIVSVLAISSVGLYFFLKKKK